MSTRNETLLDSVSQLEHRLRKVDYVLNGNKDEPIPEIQGERVGSATARLRSLESKLKAFSTDSTIVSEVLALHATVPELFHQQDNLNAPTTLPVASLVQIVLAHSKLYHNISMQLSQVQDTPIPDPASAAKLIELRPRIDRLQARQNEQAQEFATLRTRSAKVLEAWHETGVLGMAERWAEWEERLRDVEILVRRREAALKREIGDG